MKREEIVQAERELDAVLELIQESEGISGRDDIKEELSLIHISEPTRP